MKTKDKNFILAVITTIIAFIIPSWIFDKWIDGFVFFICHWLVREQFPKQYHHVLPSICRLITSAVFFFGTVIIFPFGFSFLSALPICYVVSWVGSVKKERDDLEVSNNKKDDKINELNVMVEKLNNDLAVYTNPKSEFLIRCNKAKLSKRDTEIAVKYFYEHNTPKEIWIWLCESKEYDTIDWDSIYKLLTRIGKKLNIK